MFLINQGKGFKMTFANGYTLSVQFGADNYCANRGQTGATIHNATISTACVNAEVGIFDSYKQAVKLPDQDDVWVPNVTPDDLVKIIDYVSKLPAQTS